MRRELSRREPSLRSLMLDDSGCRAACRALQSLVRETWHAEDVQVRDRPPRRHGGLVALLLCSGSCSRSARPSRCGWTVRRCPSGWSDTSAACSRTRRSGRRSAPSSSRSCSARHVDERLAARRGRWPRCRDELRNLATGWPSRGSGPSRAARMADRQRPGTSPARRRHRARPRRGRVPPPDADPQSAVARAALPQAGELAAAAVERRSTSRSPAPVGCGCCAPTRSTRSGSPSTRSATSYSCCRLAAICFVLAILVATGRQLRAIAYVGGCLVLCGAILLVARKLIGPALADALVPASETSTVRRCVRPGRSAPHSCEPRGSSRSSPAGCC